MPFVKATCTNCNGNLEVDSAKDAAICPYCGTAYIVEKAINHYNTHNNIHADVVNVYGGRTADDLFALAQLHVRLDEQDKAINVLKNMMDVYPEDSRATMMLARIWLDYFQNRTSLYRNAYEKTMWEIFSRVNWTTFWNRAVVLNGEQYKEMMERELDPICVRIQNGELREIDDDLIEDIYGIYTSGKWVPNCVLTLFKNSQLLADEFCRIEEQFGNKLVRNYLEKIYGVIACSSDSWRELRNARVLYICGNYVFIENQYYNSNVIYFRIMNMNKSDCLKKLEERLMMIEKDRVCTVCFNGIIGRFSRRCSQCNRKF